MRGKLILTEGGEEVLEVDESKVEDTLNQIIDILADLANIIDILKADVSTIDVKQKIRLYSDIVVAVFNFPMITGYSEVSGQGRRPLINSFEYLVAYALGRHIDIKPEEIYGLLKAGKLMEALTKIDESQARQILNYLNSKREKLAEIYEVLRKIPADTRPGYNISSLPSHMLLTSAIQWGLQQEGADLPILRLASVLHDVGKIKDYKNHVKGTEEFFNRLMKKLQVSEDFRRQLEYAAQKAKTHHQGEGYIDRADDMASMMDRIDPKNNPEIGVKNILKELGLNEVLNCMEKSDFDCIDNLKEDVYKDSTVKIFRRLEEKFKKMRSQELPLRDVKATSMNLLYVDFQGVQKFINYFPKLKDLATASFLVDFLVSTLPFVILDAMIRGIGNEGKQGDSAWKGNYLPLEALLSGYGGHSMIVVPSPSQNSKMTLEEIRKEILSSEILNRLDVSLGVYLAPLVGKTGKVWLYPEIWDEISAQMRARSSVDWSEKILAVSDHRPCDNCGIRPGTEMIDKGPGGKEILCTRCATVREISNLRGLTPKLKVNYKVGDKLIGLGTKSEGDGKSIDLSVVQENAMQIIAGTPLDIKEDERTHPHYVSILKFDANNASRVYKRTLTIGLFLDTSFSMDYSVKVGFSETLKELINAKGPGRETDQLDPGEELALRILIGVLYLGGDEGLILLPAVVSIPFATRFLENVSRLSNFKFKSGVVIVKPKHPVQFAITGAGTVMEEAKLTKEPVPKRDRSTKEEASENSLGIMFASSGLITDETVETTAKNYSEILRLKNDLGFMEEVIRKALNSKNNSLLRDVANLYGEIIEREPGDLTKRAKETIKVLEDVTSVYVQNRNRLHLIAYMVKERAKTQDESIRDLLTLLLKEVANSPDLRGVIPLLDALFVVKTLRSGMS
ncbi:hypothetical protein [Metallosphaera hakonensis]|nr:hypothetical protein [Metallosphaera hakonensis]AWR98664.2 hypothetical protein DFR87_01930 [Metallosphaera hakonensis JCM 8857 = DSM 7519]